MSGLRRGKREGNVVPLLALSAFGGLLSTVREYAFGTGNHIEQLPLVLRAAHPDWLAADFFTNAASTPGPRTFYSMFLGWLSGLVPLEHEFLVLLLASNLLTVLLVSLLARDLFGDTAGLVSGFLVSFGAPVRLGGASRLVNNILIPQALVMPFVVGAVWAAIRRRPLLSAALCSIASVFHPLVGLETGAILLVVTAAGPLRSDWACCTIIKDKASLLGGWLGGVVTLGATVWFWGNIMRAGRSIAPAQFVDVVAYFRHPHHYVPSTFPIRDYVELCSFLVAVAISAWWIRSQEGVSGGPLVFLSLAIGAVILLCVGGFLFVEVLPSRLWVVAQPFRLVFLINLLGLVLIAAGISRFLNGGDLQDRNEALILVLGLYAPLTTGLLFMLKLIKPLTFRLLQLPFGVYMGLMAAPVLVYWASRPSQGIHFVALYTLFLISYSARTLLKDAFGRLIWIATYLASFALVLLGFLSPSNPVDRVTSKLVSKPIFALSDIEGPIAEVARYARFNTPPDSIFLTPPDWGAFRLLAERAIVVDFKAFPFQDPAMLEWQERLFDCYGRPAAKGFPAVAEMIANYHRITDERILRLKTKYGFTYVVLYTDTETSFPILFATDEFKVVHIPP